MRGREGKKKNMRGCADTREKEKGNCEGARGEGEEKNCEGMCGERKKEL